jgi:hypothetical protein
MAVPVVAARAARAARRLAPFALEAYRRWDKLSPEEKERYRQRAREYAERGRAAIESARARRGGRGGGGPPAGRGPGAR